MTSLCFISCLDFWPDSLHNYCYPTRSRYDTQRPSQQRQPPIMKAVETHRHKHAYAEKTETQEDTFGLCRWCILLLLIPRSLQRPRHSPESMPPPQSSNCGPDAKHQPQKNRQKCCQKHHKNQETTHATKNSADINPVIGARPGVLTLWIGDAPYCMLVFFVHQELPSHSLYCSHFLMLDKAVSKMQRQRERARDSSSSFTKSVPEPRNSEIHIQRYASACKLNNSA